MAEVARLPTAPTSYYTVVKSGARWNVVLVTPIGRKTLKTVLCSLSDQAAAVAHGRDAADRAQRPFKSKGASNG